VIRVPAEPRGRLSGAWRHCVSTGRLDLALRRDHQDSLALIQREIGFRHIRGHRPLNDGMGVYRPYAWQGTRQVRHSFTHVDQVIDAYQELVLRPSTEPGVTSVEDETPPWWDERRLLGQEAAS
jgi:xylan 1,4-beta-xylosidase